MKNITKIILFSLLVFSSSSHSVEITPLLGFRGGGEFVDTFNNKKHTIDSSEIVGLIASWPYGQGQTFEVYYSHQSSKLRSINIITPSASTTVDIPLSIDYLHFGGTSTISEDKNLHTFVSGGVGFTYMSPDISGTQSDLRASLSIGVGLKWPITKRIALRLETRGLATMFNNNSTIFCNGGCTIQVNGNFFLQGEVFAGLAFRF